MIFYGREYDNFTESEFIEDVHAHAHPDLIPKLSQTREMLGLPIYPSKVPGALARFAGRRSSRHFADSLQKSCAIDWFSGARPYHTFSTVVMSGLWDGVGVYFDTHNNNGEPGVMLHTDFGRHVKKIWYRIGGVYTYPKVVGYDGPEFVNKTTRVVDAQRFWAELLQLFWRHDGPGMVHSNMD